MSFIDCNEVFLTAMIISFAIQSWIEGGVIAGVFMLNIVIGFLKSSKRRRP